LDEHLRSIRDHPCEQLRKNRNPSGEHVALIPLHKLQGGIFQNGESRLDVGLKIKS
jgi:hypothetical protein